MITAEEYARIKHRGQKHSKDSYGNLRPYTAHLKEVVHEINMLLENHAALRFFNPTIMQNAAWLHDVIEDTDATAEEITELFGKPVSEIVVAVTDEPGKNRAERKAKTYPKIRALGLPAVAIKVADRIANIWACRNQRKEDKNLLEMYTKEHDAFHAALYRSEDGLDGAWLTLNQWLEK